MGVSLKILLKEQHLGGKIKPFKCGMGKIGSILTLDGVFDAAERQTEMMYFIKNGTIRGTKMTYLYLTNVKVVDGDNKDSRPRFSADPFKVDNGVGLYNKFQIQ